MTNQLQHVVVITGLVNRYTDKVMVKKMVANHVTVLYIAVFLSTCMALDAKELKNAHGI